MAFHFFFETGPVEAVFAFAGERFEEFRRETVRLVHFKRFGALNFGAFFFFHRLEDGVQTTQTAVDVRHKVFFFRRDDALDALDRFGKFRIRNLHQVGDDRDEVEKERLLHPHLNAVENRATEQAANDVFFFFRARVDVFVNRERAGADMVGDAAQTAAVFVRQILIVVFLRADFRRRVDQRTKRVDVEVRFDALQNGRNAFEAHPGVDVFARERTQVVRRVADAVKLREDEVPNFNFALRRFVVNFGTRAANAVRAFARGGRRPEVFVFVEVLQFFGRKFDFFEPNFRGFMVVFIDGRGEHRRVDPEPFLVGQELPSPVDRFALEVVAEAEVPEHFEEGVVERGASDVVDVAGAEALLAGRGAGVVELATPEKVVFELVHPGRREENRRVPTRNEDVARTANATFGFKER